MSWPVTEKCAPWSPGPVGGRPASEVSLVTEAGSGVLRETVFHMPFLLWWVRALAYGYQASTKTEQKSH